ncbi:MAG: M48 family metallopeptidase [Gemmatimonadota bacterium]|jgi:predicted Zn-dependent protease|nr:M48 family metallopeptidase [Gemmatimonadota bacterium]MDQ8168418.1 M48 family metallopeptidase [Gemmatimonadota bacterium]MDQ8173220.1 M48 family metallopeptidase [Gemmatimonadota bacterium]
MLENTRQNGTLPPAPRAWRHTALLLTFVAGTVSCVPPTQDEVAMGNEYAQQVERELPIVRDPDVVRYINVLGDSIARVSDDRALTWRFNVVDQPEINAFAVPGGHIYVYRGLIEKTNMMSELAGVLGHEIAHVTQRHSMEQMAKAQRANIGLSGLCLFVPSACQGVAGTVLQVGAQAGFAKFSRDDEAESDRFGVTYVTRAGIDPRGIPSMFRILIAERERNPSSVDAFFASHPIEENRVANTEAEIGKLDPALLKTLTRDTRAYQSFKARLATLPRTPAKR